MTSLFQDMSKTNRENILNQASIPSKVWNIANEVMDLFETGELKGQSRPKKGPSLFTIKQQHLQPLHHLNEDFQVRKGWLTNTLDALHALDAQVYVLKTPFCITQDDKSL